MDLDRKKVTIPVTDNESVSGILTVPNDDRKARNTGILTAHGAGNDMENPLIVAFADGMAGMGFPNLRFNFPYKEKGRKTPDGQEKLEAVWKKAHRHFTKKLPVPVDHVIASGKSMGGRVASEMIARKILPVHGVIFLGYPLHPPGDLTKIRDSHLYQITAPMLFFAGTRDSLCDLEKLKAVLERISVPWKLDVIEGGDHSFHLPKSMGIQEEAVFKRIVATSAEWIEAIFPS